MPIELPAVSPLPERIAEVALRTRERKRAPSGASRAILASEISGNTVYSEKVEVPM